MARYYVHVANTTLFLGTVFVVLVCLQAMRSRLPPDAYGNHYGRTSRQAFAERWLVALPWVFLVFTLYYCVPTYRWKMLLHESSHLGPANGRLLHGGGVTSPGGRGKHGVVGGEWLYVPYSS